MWNSCRWDTDDICECGDPDCAADCGSRAGKADEGEYVVTVLLRCRQNGRIVTAKLVPSFGLGTSEPYESLITTNRSAHILVEWMQREMPEHTEDGALLPPAEIRVQTVEPGGTRQISASAVHLGSTPETTVFPTLDFVDPYASGYPVTVVLTWVCAPLPAVKRQPRVSVRRTTGRPTRTMNGMFMRGM